MGTNSVRVSIPASVANEMGSFKKAVGSILDKLGCQACCSGHDIHFELQREMIFSDNLDRDFSVKNFATQTVSKGATIGAVLSPKKGENIDHVFSTIDRVANLIDCPNCHSGFDLRFDLVRQFVINERLDSIEQEVSIDARL